MKNLFRALRARAKSDRGDSTLVTTIFVFPLFFAMLMTGVDFTLLSLDQSQVQNLTRSGARTIAILGGNNPNTISQAYGETVATACKMPNGSTISTSKAKSATECNVYKAIVTSAGVVNMDVSNVTCTPTKSTKVGTQTRCTTKWTYKTLPLSFLSLGQLNKAKGGEFKGMELTVSGTSFSEVGLP